MCYPNGQGIQNDSCEREKIEELANLIDRLENKHYCDFNSNERLKSMAKGMLKEGYSKRAKPAQELDIEKLTSIVADHYNSHPHESSSEHCRRIILAIYNAMDKSPAQEKESL